MLFKENENVILFKYKYGCLLRTIILIILTFLIKFSNVYLLYLSRLAVTILLYSLYLLETYHFEI